MKIGHGGTLDPLATGVLIAGVGRGTKHLQGFLDSTKTYETVVLFGAETDTYDRVGKIVRKAPYEHITREMVETALQRNFSGKIMQMPPIFSALRINGKKLYEYAREGKEPPTEIRPRPVEVKDIRILEWFDPGNHGFAWPKAELVGEEKAMAAKMLDKEEPAVPVSGSLIPSDTAPVVDSPSGEIEVEVDDVQTGLLPSTSKRKSPPVGASPPEISTEQAEIEDNAEKSKYSSLEPSKKRQKTTDDDGDHETNSLERKDQSVADPKPESFILPKQRLPKKINPEEFSNLSSNPVTDSPAPAPAVKISLTVTSGFYVRSFAHDLGIALGSCGLMTSLVRSRQGAFDLTPDNILEYGDLEQGEEVWGSKVQRFLEDWEKQQANA